MKHHKISQACSLALCALLAGTAMACSGNTNAPAQDEPEPAASAEEAGAKAPAEDDAIAGKAIDDGGKAGVITGEIEGGDDRFVLTVDVPTEAKAGEQGKVTVRVEPSGPWHMNLDYPTSLKIEAATGVQLAKAEQKKVDAVKLDENSCEYEIAFTPEGDGDKAFKGQFKFAVCQDDACSPVTKDIAFQVAVK